MSPILLVDDREANLLALEAILESMPVSTVRATSGGEALRIAASQPMAAIVMDVHMPDMSGFEAAAALRRSAATADTPIIFVTADNGDRTLSEAYALGAVDLLAKPFRPDALRAKVAVFLRLFEREEELRRQTAFLQQVLEGVQDAVVACDAEGRINVLNGAAKALLGAPDPGAAPQDWPLASRFYQEDAATPMAHGEVPLFRALAGEAVHNQPMMVISQRGESHHVIASAAPLRSPAGRLLGAMASAHDVTAHREAQAARLLAAAEQAKRGAAEAAASRLKASEERFSALLDSSGEGIIGIGEDGSCMFANRAATAMLGFEDHELIGRPLHHTVQHSTLDGLPMGEGASRILRALREGQPLRADDEAFWRKDGEPLHVLYSVNPMVQGGRRSGAVLTFVDIGERKRQEERLRRSQAEMTRLADRLAASDRAKGEFLATLAHELRNPLAPISNGLQLLRLSQPGPRLAATLAMLERQVRALVRLVDDLLDIARISNGKIELKSDTQDLREIARSAAEACRPAVDESRHVLATQLAAEPVWVHGDFVRLAQVIGNLLNNAVKYTPPGGRIELSVAVQDGMAIACVRDSGLGIPKSELHGIFEMFSQVPSHRQFGQGGLGIGLALVQRLAALHGGRVSVESEGEGKGSAFCVHLPLVQAPQREALAGPQQEQEQSGDGRRLNILVVDDNKDAAESLASLLELQGHAVRIAHSGQEAIELAASARPELAFLDIGLPDMSGHELAAALRRQPELASMRLVALTGWGTAQDRERTRQAGFDVHLTKPVAFEQVSAVLADAAAL